MNSSFHVAIIMDGNGRWAKKRGKLRIDGHKKGAEAAKKIIEIAPQYGIRTLSLFSFSTENWLRPKSEVSFLMNLLRNYLAENLMTLQKEQINFRVVGDRSNLSKDLVLLIEKAEAIQQKTPKLNLNLVLNYGGQQDIVQACQHLAFKVQKGEISPGDIDTGLFAEHLYTKGISEPDLLIRTSGEQRVSNFLLWQMAYSELYFTKKLWPDFCEADLQKAIIDFQQRDRRYGVRFG